MLLALLLALQLGSPEALEGVRMTVAQAAQLLSGRSIVCAANSVSLNTGHVTLHAGMGGVLSCTPG